jgi:hypothetical protein
VISFGSPVTAFSKRQDSVLRRLECMAQKAIGSLADRYTLADGQ